MQRVGGGPAAECGCVRGSSAQFTVVASLCTGPSLSHSESLCHLSSSANLRAVLDCSSARGAASLRFLSVSFFAERAIDSKACLHHTRTRRAVLSVLLMIVCCLQRAVREAAGKCRASELSSNGRRRRGEANKNRAGLSHALQESLFVRERRILPCCIARLVVIRAHLLRCAATDSSQLVCLPNHGGTAWKLSACIWLAA